MRSVDDADISVYIGLLNLRVALNVILQNTLDLWFHGSSNNIFATSILENRSHFTFKFITLVTKALLMIDEKTTNMHAKY